MGTNTPNANTRESSMLAFLSGKGPNRIPENKQGDAGPLEKKFITHVMQEIAEQDIANENKAATVSDLETQPKFLAIKRPDGTYQVRDAVSMQPSPTWRVVVRNGAEGYFCTEQQPGPHIPSVIDTVMARVHGRMFMELLEKESRHFRLQAGQELPPEVVERIRSSLYD